MMPFGLGTRVCAGRNLAQMGLRIVVAALVRNFDVAADVKETNEESMRMREAFVSAILVTASRIHESESAEYVPRFKGVQADLQPPGILTCTVCSSNQCWTTPGPIVLQKPRLR